jgi:hypothetical protein
MKRTTESGFRKMYLIDPKHVVTQSPSTVQAIQDRISMLDQEMERILNDRTLSDDTKLQKYLETLRRHIMSTRQLDRIVVQPPAEPPVSVNTIEEKKPEIPSTKIETPPKKEEEEEVVEEETIPPPPQESTAAPAFEDNEGRLKEWTRPKSYREGDLLEEFPATKRQVAADIMQHMMKRNFGLDFLKWNDATGELIHGKRHLPNTSVHENLHYLLRTNVAKDRAKPNGFDQFRNIVLSNERIRDDIERVLKKSKQTLSGSGGGAAIRWQRY